MKKSIKSGFQSIEEINKHKSNYYRSSLLGRKLKKVTNIFSVDKNVDFNELFKVSIHKFCSFEGYNYNLKNPLVLTALEVLKNPEIKPEDCYLAKFFENFAPVKFGELFHLSNKHKFHDLSSHDFCLPWFDSGPQNICSSGFFGPKDISAVTHRLIRIQNLIKNILEFSYIPTEQDVIKGYILYKNNDYSFIITSGHHRLAVLYALYNNNKLNDDKITVRFDGQRVPKFIIRQDDVTAWPCVTNNYIPAAQALEFFNSFFNCNLPCYA